MRTHASIFRVEWSELYQPPPLHDGKERPPYRTNKSANVVADSLEDALQLVRDEAPGEEQRFHSAHRLGTNTLTIISGEDTTP